MKEWLHDMLEDSFEGDRDHLILEEQEYLRRLLECLYDCLDAEKDCLKEASTLYEYIPMEVETDCDDTESIHNPQEKNEYSEQEVEVDKMENAAKQTCEIENEGNVFGTNYHRGSPIVEAPSEGQWMTLLGGVRNPLLKEISKRRNS